MGGKLTLRQHWILGYLREHPGATLKEIADASPVNEAAMARRAARYPGVKEVTIRSVEYPTAQQSMKKLLARGLVRREPVNRNPADPPYRHFLASGVAGDRFNRDF